MILRVLRAFAIEILRWSNSYRMFASFFTPLGAAFGIAASEPI